MPNTEFNSPRSRRTEAERFWAFVDKTAPNGCWLWTGFTLKGYGKFKRSRQGASYPTWFAHRVSYVWAKGEIPAGMVIDHLCRTRNCVNPDHLEAVTQQENTLRGEGIAAVNAHKTHCSKGHEFTEKNIIHSWIRKHTRQVRECRKCKNAKNRRQAIARNQRRRNEQWA